MENDVGVAWGRLFDRYGSPRQCEEKSLAAAAALVSDGLGCFPAVRGAGILH